MQTKYLVKICYYLRKYCLSELMGETDASRTPGPSIRRPRRNLHRRLDLPAALLGHLHRPLLRLHDGLRQAVLRRPHRVHFRESLPKC